MPTPRPLRSVVLLLFLTGALLSGPSIESSAASVSGTYESDANRYGNAERAKRKLVVLKVSSCLDWFAEKQARAMATKTKLYHSDLGPVMKGCHLRQVGENVAFGYASGKAVTTAWMNSPGHRANLLNRNHRLIGVGAYQDSRGYWYVAEVLGRTF